MNVTADDGVELAGTLTLPAGPGPHPAIVFLPGSGRMDRESNMGRLRMGLGSPLANTLARHGIASLRYDRRGVGESPGDWRTVGFCDNRTDAAAALRALRQRPDIRPEATGVIGHSEGAVHAIWLGAHHQPAALVLLAGYARPGDEAVQWQLNRLPKLLRGFAIRRLSRLKSTTTDVARVAGLKMNAKWWREQMAYDPRMDLAAIGAPVLAITGEKDIQVDPGDVAVIASHAGGEVEARTVPDLTHILRRDSGKASLRSYGRLLRQPVEADVLEDIAQWLRGKLG